MVLFDQVPVTGLKTPFRDGYVRDLAEDVLQLAKVSSSLFYTNLFCSSPLTHYLMITILLSVVQNGLERRGYKEVGFLKEVDEVVRTGDAFSTLFLFCQDKN